MQIVCKRHSEIPHTSKLFSDLLYHFDRVSSFYPHAPLDPLGLAASAREIDFSPDRRARLVSALRAQGNSGALLDALGKEGTVAVLTGQQVGLFSGPAYSVYKALTAVRLARELTSRDIPAVPVFWLATEDHDLDEVSSAWTFSPAHEPVSLRVEHASKSDIPVGGIPLSGLPLDALRKSMQGFPFGEEVNALVGEWYAAGRTFGEAFAGLLRGILGRHGMLFFDPMHPESRKLAAPFLAQAVDAAPELTEELLERNRKLATAGYHAQVHIERATSLFFLLEDGHRINLRRKNGGYFARDRQFEAAYLRGHAEALSPNATLRPVVQDSMFPTVAYIGGPAELAYLAQSEVIYRKLLGRMPVAVPRNAFTLVDQRAGKLIRRYGLHLESFFGGEYHLFELIAGKLVPPELDALFDEVSTANEANLERLRGSIGKFDSSLEAAWSKSAAKMQYQLRKMRRKAAREAFRRNDRAREEARYLYHLLYPHKHLQERFYSILPFVAAHGFDLIDRLYETVHVDCADHHLLFL
ncbi:MAG: putative cysteine ligase BshC [Bryobacteraceae bacterium]|nr:putative cysteine ligase BshC [Bryobacteraceae bacterium]